MSKVYKKDRALWCSTRDLTQGELDSLMVLYGIKQVVKFTDPNVNQILKAAEENRCSIIAGENWPLLTLLSLKDFPEVKVIQVEHVWNSAFKYYHIN